jgi:hypothetical protein
MAKNFWQIMEKYEFRLLSGAVDGFPVLVSLLSHEGGGLDRTTLATLLLRLFEDSRLLCFRRRAASNISSGNLFGGIHEQSCFFVPSKDEIELHLMTNKGSDALAYALAPRGAKEWEEIARPEWDRYIFDSYDFGEGSNSRIDTIELTGQRFRLEEAMKIIADYRALAGSESWQEFSPWSATYWKTLPKGAKVTFAATADLTVRNYTTEESRRWQTFKTWYTDPKEFQEPGYWPATEVGFGLIREERPLPISAPRLADHPPTCC